MIFFSFFFSFFFFILELPRESTVRQKFLGTGLPGDYRDHGAADYGSAPSGQAPRGYSDNRFDYDPRGWKGQSSGGGVSSFSIG